jgi:NitT/TauT family transport system permease protein
MISKTRIMQALANSVLLFLLLLAWEGLGHWGLYNTTLLPTPTSVFLAWRELLYAGTQPDMTWFDFQKESVLLRAARESVKRVLIGFSTAALSAGLLAILLSRFKPIKNNIKPLIEFLRPIAPIAWIPLAILWFGPGDPAACFIVFVGSFFPILLGTLLGVQNVPENCLNAAKSVGASWWLRLTDVIWPAAKPSIVTGLRVGLGIGWMSVVAAEFVGVPTGLGYLIDVSRRVLKPEQAIAVMATIGFIGLSMNWLIEIYVRKTMRWWRESSAI